MLSLMHQVWNVSPNVRQKDGLQGFGFSKMWAANTQTIRGGGDSRATEGWKMGLQGAKSEAS
jgi:hypothetical protein